MFNLQKFGWQYLSLQVLSQVYIVDFYKKFNYNFNLIFKFYIISYNILLLIHFIQYINFNVSINVLVTFIFYLTLVLGFLFILIYELVKIVKFVKNIDNILKVKGLSINSEKTIFIDNYYKFGFVILIPLLIFIFRIYYIFSLLQFIIILLILFAIFIVFTSQKIIDFLYNCLRLPKGEEAIYLLLK